MRVLSGRVFLISGVVLLAGITGPSVFNWLISAPFAPPDYSALWSFSFLSWESVKLGANGMMVKTIYEPLSLSRDLGYVLLASTGVAILGQRSFGRMWKAPIGIPQRLRAASPTSLHRRPRNPCVQRSSSSSLKTRK